MIETAELFPPLNEKLIILLRGLDDGDFNRPTQFPDWKVKDICAHLLDTSLRRLSSERDSYVSQEKAVINTYNDLITRVTELADRWSLAFSYVSPHILIELIEKYQNELYEYIKRLDPLGTAHFPVAWAGEEKSYNWFDIAREYTERWHHQMQIREALGKEPLYERALYFPVLDTFMQALPFHYRNFKRESGYVLCVTVTGSAGGKWFLEWNDGFRLVDSPSSEARTDIFIAQENAWKICTRWLDKSVYKVAWKGDRELAEHITTMNCLLIKD
jgi:hypothetical protein